jgi:hypothetical protein
MKKNTIPKKIINHFHLSHKLLGGKLSAKEFELMLKESYKKPNERQNIGDYIIDTSLSTPENVVFYNPKTKEVKNVYAGTQGTLKDWGNNALYAVGMHKYSNRYKRANDIEKKVEEKYGTDNLDILGHSQSGAFTQELGKNAKNVVVLNPATHPLYTPKSKNATVVRSTGDAVSSLNKLNPFNWGKKANIEIKSKTSNPITEHMPAVLEGLDKDRILGNGRYPLTKHSTQLLHRLIGKGHNNNELEKINYYLLNQLKEILDVLNYSDDKKIKYLNRNNYNI